MAGDLEGDGFGCDAARPCGAAITSRARDQRREDDVGVSDDDDWQLSSRTSCSLAPWALSRAWTTRRGCHLSEKVIGTAPARWGAVVSGPKDPPDSRCNTSRGVMKE
jgi:hypothetical protein